MRYLYFLTALLLSACILISGCGEMEKSEADYKKEAIAINYEDIARNPDSFAKKVVFVTGIVMESKENNKKVELLLRDTTSLNHYFLISYTSKENEERFIKRDIIRVWGNFQKVSTRPDPNALGLTQINTVDINAKYILRPMWSSLGSGLSSFIGTIDGKKNELYIEEKKVNKNNMEIKGFIVKEIFGNNFKFKGTIDDNGMGKVKFIDGKNNDTNTEATIKITQNTIEFNTPEFKFEKLIGFQQTKILTLESDNYIFSITKK